jgi:hypothetical protein
MKVAICTPVYGDPKAQYTGSLAALLLKTPELCPDVEISYSLVQGHLVAARNDLAGAALASDADYTLWIDADMSVPPSGLRRLLSLGLPVVGANYLSKDARPRPTAMRNGSEVMTTIELHDAKAVEPVDYLGLGFCLISCAALKRIGGPIFRPHPDSVTFLGEDRLLFERLRQAGETVHVDHVVSWYIDHIGSRAFSFRTP